jgi:multidrug resistance efflux pump
MTEFAPGFCPELGRKCVDTQAEIERLRAALQEIATDIESRAAKSGYIARRALEEGQK